VQFRRAVSDSWGRVRAGVWPAGQCGLAAAGAWAISTEVLGHSRPFFASVAAVVALGVGGGGRLTRTAQLAAGVTLGVAVGDAWVGVFGQGIWQIGVVVFLALLAAVAINGAGLAVTQAAVQAVFVVALPRVPNSGIHRWQDALVGGATALLVAAVLPANPWKDAKRLRRLYISDLADVLRATSAGTRSGSSSEVAEALARGRALETVLDRWQTALANGRETSRLSPFRDGRSEFWQSGVRLTQGMLRASRNLRVLVRRLMAATEAGHPIPPVLADLLDELADALALAQCSDAAIGPLVDLAGRLDPVALGASSLTAQVVVGQLRVAVVDLLDGLGLEHDRARNALPSLAS
jgi:uncharacterized membrane protein YgaE (UPF0421/DUF939 family)